MVNKMKVLINIKPNEMLKRRIRNEVKGVDFVFTAESAVGYTQGHGEEWGQPPHDTEEMLREIRDTDVLFGYLTREMFKVAEKLRWVQAPISGLENFMFPELARSDIVITDSTGFYGEEIASHAFSLILAFSRDLPKLLRSQEQEIWEKHGNIRTVPLLSKTLGVIGLGGIGQEVAKAGVAFGMRVVATRAHPEKGKPHFVDKVWGPEGLNKLLRESDFVVICTPQTPKTGKMIKTRELKIMKKTAFLINVGRGEVVDLENLTEALRKGDIAGAGLDVFEQEPLPKGHMLWRMKNVIITPHCASIGLLPLYWERRVSLFIKNLKRYIEGKDLLSIVDKQIWC